MSGEVTVELSLPGFTSGSAVVVSAQPGLRHTVQLATVDGEGTARLVEVTFSVRGAVCPDPAAHELDCDETDHDHRGDCNGTVREYMTQAPILSLLAGEQVRLCAAHAQMHGRHIRALPR